MPFLTVARAHADAHGGVFLLREDHAALIGNVSLLEAQLRKALTEVDSLRSDLRTIGEAQGWYAPSASPSPLSSGFASAMSSWKRREGRHSHP